jgi:hypothetical protein
LGPFPGPNHWRRCEGRPGRRNRGQRG